MTRLVASAGRVVVLTTGHDPLDDRIYYKEVLTMLGFCPDLWLVAKGGPGRPSGLSDAVLWCGLSTAASWKGRLFRVAEACWKLWRLKPRVCHFHDPEMLLAAPLLRVLLPSCKQVYDCHEVYPEAILGSKRVPKWIRPLAAKAVDTLERALAARVDAVIATDSDVGERFCESRTIRRVIFNFPALDLFPAPEKFGGHSGDRPVLLYQGSMGVDRGLFVMIEAMPAIVREYPRALLRLVGPMEGRLRAACEEMIQALGLEGAVELVGAVSHLAIPALVSEATVGLVPFLRTPKLMKNVSIKQFEYMACGIPVLATNLPPAARFVARARAGLLVTPGDPKALADGAMLLLLDGQLREDMGRAGRRWVEEEWNWGKMEVRLRELYQTLLG